MFKKHVFYCKVKILTLRQGREIAAADELRGTVIRVTNYYKYTTNFMIE